MFLGQKCSFFRLELIISDSHLTPFVLTLSRTRKNRNNTNCKTHKKITKNTNRIKMVTCCTTWINIEIKIKIKFMFIRFYSLSGLIIDS